VDTVSVKQGSDVLTFATDEIDMIVEARLDEVFEMIDKELSSIQRSGKLPGGAVLVGGGANLKGIESVAKDRLRMSARTAKMDTFQDVSGNVHELKFATAIGLMLLDIDVELGGQQPNSKKDHTGTSAAQAGKAAKKAMSGISSLLKKLKP
jgi:cell division protein FtsA